MQNKIFTFTMPGFIGYDDLQILCVGYLYKKNWLSAYLDYTHNGEK